MEVGEGRERGLDKSLQISLWTGKSCVYNIGGLDAEEQFLYEVVKSAGAFANFKFRLFLQILKAFRSSMANEIWKKEHC